MLTEPLVAKPHVAPPRPRRGVLEPARGRLGARLQAAPPLTPATGSSAQSTPPLPRNHPRANFTNGLSFTNSVFWCSFAQIHAAPVGVARCGTRNVNLTTTISPTSGRRSRWLEPAKTCRVRSSALPDDCTNGPILSIQGMNGSGDPRPDNEGVSHWLLLLAVSARCSASRCCF